MRQELKGFLFVVLAASLWGMAGTVAKYLFNKAVNPLILVEVRLCLAALILGCILWIFARPQLSIDRKDIPYLITLGIFGVAGVQFAYFFTISQTNVATAVFLQYISPVMVALYAVIFQKEKLGSLKVMSLTLAIAGSYFMVFSQGLSVTPLGLISGLASAVFVTVYTIYGGRGLQKYSPWTLLFYCFMTGAFAAFFVVPPWRIPIDTFSISNMLFFLYIAIFATIVPFGAYFLGLRHLKATTAGIIATLEPVVAALTAFLMLNEKLTPVQMMGAAMVLASVIIIQISKPQGGVAKQGKANTKVS